MGLFDDLLMKPSDNPTPNGSTSQASSGQGSSGGTQDPITPATTPVIKIEKTDEISILTESPALTASHEPPPIQNFATDDISSIIVTHETSNPPIITQQEESIIGSSGSDSIIIENIEPSVSQSVDPVTSDTVIQSNQNTDLGNLFGDISSDDVPPMVTTESIQETSSDSVEASPIAADVITKDTEITQQSSGEAYEHPAEFIVASIARIDAMIQKIETAHNAKLEEGLRYRAEKEKYSTLEEQSYAIAEKYLTEKEHAMSMRNYFVEQGNVHEKKSPTEVMSVEATLTGLAVQNAVTETVKNDKKVKSKKEEPAGILEL